MRTTIAARIPTVLLAGGLLMGCGPEPDDTVEEQAEPALGLDALPIQVSAMLHIDPLPCDGNEEQVLRVYESHREAIQWYLELADQTGLSISAQMVGVYAEAAVRQGHESDFASFMPGGPHHLGTHLHAHVHGAAPYTWRDLGIAEREDPEQVAQVFGDQIPWINDVFDGAGGTAEDNWLFHGTHAAYTGMQGPLLRQDGSVALPYDNAYQACDAPRGITYLYRGSCYDEPDGGGPFAKIAEVGGIIGEDREHGPEGMVYGSLPYQRRDFLRVYLDWREGVRRGETQGVRHFTWMIHPYQLGSIYQATDGRNPRETITELVSWLDDSFIERADDTGQTVARFANMAEMVDAYGQWEADHPEDSAAQSAAVAAAQSGNGELPKYHYLLAIHDRLETTYHEEQVDLDAAVVAHRFIDHDSGADVFVLFAKGDPVTLPLGGELPEVAELLRGDGSTERVEAELTLGPEPVLLETAP